MQEGPPHGAGAPLPGCAYIWQREGSADALPSLSGTNALCWPAASCSPTDSLRSTIGARGLNFWVRNGARCASPAMAAGRHRAFICPSVPWGPHSARQPSIQHPHAPGIGDEELGRLVQLG